MDGMGENFSEQEAKASFWKKNTKAVPGRWDYIWTLCFRLVYEGKNVICMLLICIPW